MHDTLEPTGGATDRGRDSLAKRLRDLPTEIQPPCNWQDFQRRSRVRTDGAAGSLHWRHVAVAATVLVVMCGIAVWGRVGGEVGSAAGTNSEVQAEAEVGAGAESDIDALRATHNGSQLVHRTQDSRAIESWLATLPREPVVVRVGTRADVARLEDRIAQVDDLLTSEQVEGVRPERVRALRQERTRLVGSLAQVRYAEVVASELP